MQSLDPNPMQGGQREQGLHLKELTNFLLRNRWLIATVFTLVVVSTTVFTFVVPPTYEGVTTLRVDKERTNLPVLDALSTLSSGSEIETEMEVLRSRTVADRVLDELALQVVVKRPWRVSRYELFDDVKVEWDAPKAVYRFEQTEEGRFLVRQRGEDEPIGTFGVGERVPLRGAEVRLAPGAVKHKVIRIAVREFEDALESYYKTVAIFQPNRDADLIGIRWDGPDPILTSKIPNSIAAHFLTWREQVRKTEAFSTVDFLDEQLDSLEVQLSAAEDLLREFREDARVVDLKFEAEMHINRLAQLQAERDRLDAEREALANLFEEVRNTPRTTDGPSPYRRLIAFPSLLANFAVSELFRSLAEVENQRAELLNRRTHEDPDVIVLTRRIEELENQLRLIAVTYLEGLANQVRSIDEKLLTFRDQLEVVPAREVQFARLERRAEVLKEIYIMLATRQKEAEIAGAIEDASIQVVDAAQVQRKPVKPRKKLNIALSLALGMVLGVGVAFVRENMDTALRTREDLQALLGGAAVLGLIPRIAEANGKGRDRAAATVEAAAPFQARLVTGRDPRNPISEAYRSLRTNITFANPDRPPRSLVFTSALPGDGKSTTSSNLAITLAQQGLRTLLIDADMRRGVLHDVFAARREPGLSNVLLDQVTLEEAVQWVSLGEDTRLEFLPTGTLPPNPAELLGAERMRALLERLEGDYDVVILDAPPLNAVTDAALLGTNADGVILVARSGVTESAAAAYAMEQLRNVRAPVLGGVLNDIDVKKERYYGSYGAVSYYYYGSDQG